MRGSARRALPLLLACALLSFLHAPVGAHEYWRQREPPRNGPPSPAQQMQDKMPLATKRGNGDPSPARQMQLNQNGGAAAYEEPVPESKRQPAIQREPRRRHPPEH